MPANKYSIAFDQIVIAPAVKRVVAIEVDEVVIARAAKELVIAKPAIQKVVANSSLDIVVAASTKPLVLSILLHGKNYGYRIIQEIEHLSGGELAWTDAMLYPVLKRIEKEALIRSQCV